MAVGRVTSRGAVSTVAERAGRAGPPGPHAHARSTHGHGHKPAHAGTLRDALILLVAVVVVLLGREQRVMLVNLIHKADCIHKGVESVDDGGWCWYWRGGGRYGVAAAGDAAAR